MIMRMCYNEDNLPFHNHHHFSSELIFIVDGEVEFTISNKNYTAKKGTIVFINSFEQHEVNIIKAPYKRFFLTLNNAEIERNLLRSPLISIFKNRPFGFAHCIDMDKPQVYDIFAQLFEENKKENAFSSSMIANLLEQLLIHVYRTVPQNFVEFENPIKDRVNEIQNYIEKHFTENIKISQLAEMFFITPYYLSHIFKSQVGYSPKQYIMLNRLAYAKELLETTDMQIGQISFKCGFTDTNNFIRSFREVFAKSPKQFKDEL